MISVGIFTGYYPYTLAETIERAKKDGMSCVQLDLEFPEATSPKRKQIRSVMLSVMRIFRS